jgi:uncharacterized iron-regulated membrane protein
MTDAAIAQGAGSAALYRAVWRWHFYAGLIVLPFMILLAVTGAIYIFKDEINDLLHRDLRIMQAQGAETLPPSALVAAALDAHPGTLRVFMPPAAPDRAAQVKIAGDDGVRRTVFVNPHDGAVLGAQWDAGAAGSPEMWVVRKLHSLEYFGWLGNRAVEAAAGWAVVLAGTGLYLWWPRGRTIGVWAPRRTPGRGRWRDLHAVTGAYAAVFIVFLSLTGLPWSGVWGKQFYDLAYTLGIGMPDGYWSQYPTSTVPTAEALDRAPWILENQPMPLSLAAEAFPAKLDHVVARVEALGVHPGYALNVPTSPQGVFTASVYPDDIRYERVVHLDQYSGDVLFDMSFSDLGALGQAAEWGISVHMGQEFGVVNQIVMLLACMAIVLMSVAAAAMWWKRRPAGSLGAPRIPEDWRAPRAVAVIAIGAGVFFPLTGLTLLAALALDLLAQRVMWLRAA